jgi:hypothetical protein
MIGPVNIVMLLTDGFGGFGGIAKFNRDFMHALDACSVGRKAYALSSREAYREATAYRL